jgi:soluble lytic murein transglycosylase
MPDDYPKGDMTLDGVFVLALSRMERGDWAGASGVLDRAVAMVGAQDVGRGPEWSGRERYFQARALVETGNLEAGLQQYATLVQHYPLSYYMLHAFTQLWRHDAPRAKATLEQALEHAKTVPFAMGQPEQFAQAEVLRVMELFRQGDADSARRELQINGLLRKSKASAVLWGISQLYQTAGSDRYSHAVPRWQLTDWLSHWPAGQWARGWQLAFPRPYLENVTQQAAARGVEPQLIYAVMREESAFHAEAVSPANAYGLMQVIPPTARHFGSQSGTPHDKNALVQPEVSITLGSHVLSSYGGRFPHDPLLAIPAYNAGPGRPLRWMAERPQLPFDLWVELIPYRETRRYTKRVLASRAAYAFLYYEPDALAALRLPLGLAGASRGSSASD